MGRKFIAITHKSVDVGFLLSYKIIKAEIKTFAINKNE